MKSISKKKRKFISIFLSFIMMVSLFAGFCPEKVYADDIILENIDITSKSITIQGASRDNYYALFNAIGEKLVSWSNELGEDGNIVYPDLASNTEYIVKVVTQENFDEASNSPKNENEVQETEVTTAIDPLNPGQDNQDSKPVITPDSNQIVITGLNKEYQYSLLNEAEEMVKDYQSTDENGTVTFSELRSGSKYYLVAKTETNNLSDKIEITTLKDLYLSIVKLLYDETEYKEIDTDIYEAKGEYINYGGYNLQCEWDSEKQTYGHLSVKEQLENLVKQKPEFGTYQVVEYAYSETNDYSTYPYQYYNTKKLTLIANSLDDFIDKLNGEDEDWKYYEDKLWTDGKVNCRSIKNIYLVCGQEEKGSFQPFYVGYVTSFTYNNKTIYRTFHDDGYVSSGNGFKREADEILAAFGINDTAASVSSDKGKFHFEDGKTNISVWRDFGSDTLVITGTNGKKYSFACGSLKMLDNKDALVNVSSGNEILVAVGETENFGKILEKNGVPHAGGCVTLSDSKSDNAEIAVVNGNEVTGVAAGSTTITGYVGTSGCTYWGVTGSNAVTIHVKVVDPVTFNLNGGTGTAPAYALPGYITMPTTSAKYPLSGGSYGNFKGWSKDPYAQTPEYLPGHSYNVTSGTLYAIYDVDGAKIDLEFISDGKTVLTKRLLPGQQVIAPEGINKSGYELEGWYKDEAFEKEYIFDESALMPADGLKLYAKWKAVTPPKPTTPPVHTHSWNGGTITKQPTCTEKGLRKYSCYCGAENQEYIDALGHDWSGEWTVLEEATATKDGKKVTYCTRGCGQKKVEVIPAIGSEDVEDEEEGTLKKDAEVAPDAPIEEATLENKKSELLAAPNIFTEAERQRINNGVEAKVWLEVSKTKEGSIPASDKTKIENEAKNIMGDNPTITFFEADLFKQIASETKTKLHEPGIDIKVTIRIPSELLNYDATKNRKYKIIRLHNGEVTVLTGEFDKATGEFAFETDRFSTYAIVYNDTPIDPGTLTPGIKQEGDQMQYVKNDGTIAKEEWVKQYDNWYYAGEDGNLKTGWFKYEKDGNWYYLNKETRKMETGWHQEETGDWYYLDQTSGAMHEGWLKDNQDGKWYYLNPGSGKMQLGWLHTEDGKWYYLNPVAAKQSWYMVDGKWVYDGIGERPLGSMYANEMTPDGYRVDETGAWIK